MNIEYSYKIFIEGPQGSGKSSLSKYISEQLDCKLKRGIPSGEELNKLSNNQIWIAVKEIANLPENAVYDRSVLSLVSYNSKKKPKYENLFYNLGKSQVSKINKNFKTLWVFIDSDPNSCLERQTDGFHSLDSLSEMKKEVVVYNQLYSKLEQDLDDSTLIKVRNGPDIEVISFLTNSTDEICTRLFKNKK